MPTFTIIKGGQTLQTLKLEDERIVIGADRSCRIFIDDLLISLKQAVFVKAAGGYQIEPIARTPSLTLNGRPVDQPSPVTDGDILEIEGYQIRVELGHRPVAPLQQAPPPPPPEVSVESVPPPLDVLTDPAKTIFHVPVKPLGQLVVIAGPLKGTARPLSPGEEVRIGRDQSQNEIVIRADSKGEIDRSISRRHASIHVDGTNVFVEDKKSVAGTFVNGRQVPPNQRIPLKSGDLIEIHSAKESTVLRLELHAPTGAAPVAASHADLPPLSSVPDVPPPLADVLPPPLSSPRLSSPPPLTPPSRREPVPAWEPPPPEPVPDEIRRPSRARARSSFDDNPFQPVEEPGWFASLPRWVLFAGGAGLIILVVSLLLICR